MIELDDLTPEKFDQYPVWCWTDDNEKYQPVSSFVPLPDDKGDLFIKVKLACADGSRFDGLIVGYESYHAFSIFYEGEEYSMNLRSKQLLSIGLNKLWKGIGREIENLFPIDFEANLFYQSGEKVEGKLETKFWK